MEKPRIDTTAVEVPADLASPALYRVDAAHHPRVDRAEMLRYLGYGGQQIEPGLSQRIELVVERLELDIEPRGVRRVFAVDATDVDEQGEPCIRLVGTNVELRGRDIYRHLKDARMAALMACTLGMDAERRLRTTGAQQPLEGAVLDAACSAYVEAAVEQMDQQVKAAASAHGLAGNWRFSPGYGDCPLSAQRSIVNALNATRLIGLTVTPTSLLMPTKSVTAVIGLFDDEVHDAQSRPTCNICRMREHCRFRAAHTTCYSSHQEPSMFTPLITHDSDGTALAAPVDTARRNGAKYKTRTIDDLRIKDDRLRAAVEGTGHLLFDGGMGTMLQAAGMKAGALPELLNFEEPQVITDIQRQYVEAGCDVITANTFGANAHKLDGAATVADVFAAAVTCAREAGARYVAGDIGPIGALLRPLGTLSFDEAYDLFAEEVRAGVAAGVDLFIIETMTDLAEIKAAVLACRENSDLPVFATMTFEEDGRTFLGTSPEVAAITLDAIGADVLGINCSQGPAELRGLAARMLTVTDKPVMVQANAGLPRVDDDGNTVFDIQAPEYAEAVAGMIEDGVSVVGGCCGTTPTHMAALRTLIDNHTPSVRHRKPSMSVTSAQTVVDLPCDGHKIAVIGERINPTGKKRLQQALRDGDLDYVVSQGISQQEQGADILDVNVGLPEIDEVKIIQQATEQLQGSTLLPLQIDSTDPAAVEAAVRRYAGKPIINSVNGKQQIMDEIFPLVAHYGTNVVGLTLDEGGIPDTAEARFAIAERIVAEAARYGIGPDRILIDCLVMTASTNQRQAEQILRAMSLCKERLGVKCALGVSNISFGLPARPLLGSVFLAAAFGAGLDAPIMNPGSKRFMDTVYSYRVLSVEDEGSTGYIERYAGWTDPYKIAANPAAAQAASSDAAPAAGTTASADDDPIRHMVVSGRKGEIAAETERLLADYDAMDLINNHFIPALDEVGVLFDQGKFFLPQLMASAEAARVGFDTIKRLMPAGEIADKGKICVATVKGDIHDIGKNIVKMLLDNYGYTVFDLGRDVDPQEVLKTVKERDIKLVGLSALMTTTVVAMEETIKLLHAEVPGVKIIVGGAVLTPEYAKQIGADYYAKDAAESARIAEEVFGR